jgi:MutS-like protein
VSADPPALYRERSNARTAEHARAERRVDLLGNIRLTLAVLALILIILPLFLRSDWPWWGLVPLFFAFIVLGVKLDRAFDERRRLAAAVRFYKHGIDRLEERWRELPDRGDDLKDTLGASCPYAGDLDLFGSASLFQLLSRAETRIGRRVLGEHLVHLADKETALARQAAVRELAPMIDLREALVAQAAGEDASPLDDQRLLDWAEKSEPVPRTSLLTAIGIALPISLTASIALFIAGIRPLLAPAVIMQLVAIGLTRKLTQDRAEVLAGPDRVLSRYARMIETIEGARWASPLLASIRARIASDGGEMSASRQIKILHRLVDLLDARLNIFFALTLGPLLMWDLNLVLRAERFRTTTGRMLRGWLESIGEIEALASFASLAFERPGYAMPELGEGDPIFRAEGLAHPLIDRTKVVANDVELAGKGALIILSGSNMSGKSTLLRAVGLATVLARAGAPVAASRLTLGTMTLMTSVRIVDSLAQGTSHFYAELLRIKAIVDEARAPSAHVLYLLDEMLHGTNSRERYIGAASVIRWLSQHGAIGIVTTHDLALANIAAELPAGRAKNMHFSDEVDGEKIRFDYELREGPVSSTNALRLMRAVGIDIELEP